MITIAKPLLMKTVKSSLIGQAEQALKKQVALGYYQLPEFALDDADELCCWVKLGIGASQKNQMPRPNHQK